MKRRWRILLAAAALLLVAGVVWALATGAPVGRVLGLAADDGEKLLRRPMRPMRPPHGGARVVVFALDGVGEREMLHALRSGTMPVTAGLLGASDHGLESAHAVEGVLSVLPSTTLAAWTSLFTGEPPARTGVPGNEWYAREERRFYAPAPISVKGVEDLLATYTDGLLGHVVRVPTLYEHANVRSYATLAQLHRGADLLVLPDLSVLDDLGAAAIAGLADDEASVEHEAYAELDVAPIDRLLVSFREHGLPDLQVVYFPGVDLYTHMAEPALPSQQAYLRDVVDPAVARVLEAYRAAGALDATWIVFVADHGHTPVLADERHALGTDEDVDPPGVLVRAGFRLRPFRVDLDEEEQDYQATLAYQGAMAYVYLADRSTCPAPGDRCNWLRPPRFEEDVLPVVRAFDEANRAGRHVPALQGTLDLILARQPRPTTQDALPFEVWDGTRLVPIAEFLGRHARPDLLDFEARMRGLAAGPFGHRAGDVLLLAKSGMERPIEDRYYFSGRYRSWHGSPAAQDSRIPLVVGRAGLSADAIRERVTRAAGERPSQLDVMRLVLALLREP